MHPGRGCPSLTQRVVSDVRPGLGGLRPRWYCRMVSGTWGRLGETVPSRTRSVSCRLNDSVAKLLHLVMAIKKLLFIDANIWLDFYRSRKRGSPRFTQTRRSNLCQCNRHIPIRKRVQEESSSRHFGSNTGTETACPNSAAWLSFGGTSHEDDYKESEGCGEAG